MFFPAVFRGFFHFNLFFVLFIDNRGATKRFFEFRSLKAVLDMIVNPLALEMNADWNIFR